MTIIIAHRGNLEGTNTNENKPDYVEEALNKGVHVEVDVWSNNGLYTGHDRPLYPITLQFLQRDRVWVHAKDWKTFRELLPGGLNLFIQEWEELALTTNGYIWHHSRDTWFYKNSIATCLDFKPEMQRVNLYGICSDDALKFHNLYKLQPLLPPFDVLIIDIDGVLTKTKTYNLGGRAEYKQFMDIDFTAIKRFKAAGIKVCFLSADPSNKNLAKNRNTDFIYAMPENGIIDKSLELDYICEKYNTTPERCCFVGDDFYDISLMQKVGVAYCPNSSPKAVRRACVALQRGPGEGIIAELFDLYEDQLDKSYPYDSL